jgi:hypothetical protein
MAGWKPGHATRRPRCCRRKPRRFSRHRSHQGADRKFSAIRQSMVALGQASSISQGSLESGDRPVNVFHERISKVFSHTAPGSGKGTLRPKSTARAEEAASGASLLKPGWWESFENYLRPNRTTSRPSARIVHPRPLSERPVREISENKQCR